MRTETGSFTGGRVAVTNVLAALPADRVPAARVRRKHTDGEHDATVGLTGAPDNRIGPRVPYHDRLFAVVSVWSRIYSERGSELANSTDAAKPWTL